MKLTKIFLSIAISVIILTVFIPKNILAQSGGNCVNGSNDAGLCNPVEFASNIKAFGYKIIDTFTTFFAITALIMVVYSGFRMIIAQGNEEALTVAKGSLQWAISGLILAMFAFVIVSAVGNYLGVRDLTGSYTGNNPVQNPIAADSFLNLLYQMLDGFLGVTGFLAILMIIFGGFRYITSAGNEEQAASAKTTLQWSIIGLVVILLSYVLVRATITFFNP
ncbi:MAG: MMCAP2_0565 family pilin-like conjugal transfer protein [Candidatus Doudnabacteria bacterium]